LNSGPSPRATPPVLFLWKVFQDRVSQSICPGWLRTVILLISASWVAMITGVNHWRPANTLLLEPCTQPFLGVSLGLLALAEASCCVIRILSPYGEAQVARKCLDNSHMSTVLETSPPAPFSLQIIAAQLIVCNPAKPLLGSWHRETEIIMFK
jgi:hypothetical protein